jgi:hypothetical protein
MKHVSRAAWVSVIFFLANISVASHADTGAAAPGQTRIADLGYRQGILFEGVESAHTRTLFFPVPRDVPMAGGRLRVQVASSAVLHRTSNITILLNDVPRATAVLRASMQPQTIDVPLERTELEPGFLRVTFKVALLVSEDNCLDERVGGVFAHILPETALTLNASGAPTTIRAAVAMLPQTVRISLPTGALSNESYALAWSLNEAMLRAGKRVEIVRLPQIGDVVIAAPERIREALARTRHTGEIATVIPPGKHNLALLKIGTRHTIAITDSSPSTLAFIRTVWSPVAAGRTYDLGSTTAKQTADGGHYELRLNELGLDTSTRYAHRAAEWGFTASPEQLPGGYVPDRINLGVLATPSVSGQRVLLYVYLNGTLEEIVRLKDDAREQRMTIALTERLLRRTNHIRIVAQRELVTGNCHGEPSRYPIQLTPDSTLRVEKRDRNPHNFDMLATYLGGGFDAYVPASWLDQPERSLPFLGQLTTGLSLTLDPMRMKVYKDNEPIKPREPFIALGGTQLDGKVPIHLDRGRVEIADSRGNILVDVDKLPNVVIAQVAKSGDYGLWVTSTDTSIPRSVRQLGFGAGDVAFIDDGGVFLEYDSRLREQARVRYPMFRDFLTLLEEYRFWLLALVWIGITVLFLHLYRKLRESRNATRN